MKSAIKIIVFVVLSVFWVSTSMALHELFKKMDSNRDGQIDRGEFAGDMKRDAFNKLDSDKDEHVSQDEWGNGNFIEAGKGAEVFKSVDKNADKRISFIEFSDYSEKYSNIEEAFMTSDKNRDGALAPDEITLRPLFRFITIRY
ncbi:MAG: hypothetical protein C4560_06180 [Nitrospiraceae bacterium]|nr:MAG: hypothetical protein C4560_06180 [Nitrospiraceae bacterium]